MSSPKAGGTPAGAMGRRGGGLARFGERARLLAVLVWLGGCILGDEDPDGDGFLAPYDCDDRDGSVHPDAPERCNGGDDDCDGLVDEQDAVDAPSWYRDADLDGYGDPRDVSTVCQAPDGYVDNDLDCDDTAADINPELTWYVDDDRDGWGDPAGALQSCSPPSDAAVAYVRDGGDCDDENPDVNPGETEVCDGLDNDCVDGPDDGVGERFYADSDGDGYGDPDAYVVTCAAPSGYVSDGTDCDDADVAVNPGATRICNDGVDNACDGDATAWLACEAPAADALLLLGGTAALEGVGDAVASAGDIDGDGFDDVIVGARGYSRAGDGVYEGAAYLVYGGPLSGRRAIGEDALIIEGMRGGDAVGTSVAGVGDVDGDGTPDVVIGALTYEEVHNNEGAAFFFSGAGLGGPGQLDVDSADAIIRGGFIADWMGSSVAGVGDVGGPGIDTPSVDDDYADFIVGATGRPFGEAANAGALVVVFGGPHLSDATLDTLDVDEGALIEGEVPADAPVDLSLGTTVAGPADIDGDGIHDVVSSSWKIDGHRGGLYFMAGPISGTVNADAADARLLGAEPDSLGGYAIAIVDDALGDGRPGVLVGSPTQSTGASLAGAVHLISYAGSWGEMDGTTFDENSGGAILGGRRLESAGFGLCSGGDLDGDGSQDVVIGARGDGAEIQARAWVFFGPSGDLFAGTRSTAEADVTIVESDLFSQMGTRCATLGQFTGSGVDAVGLAANELDVDWTDSGGTMVNDAGGVYVMQGFGL